jgi:hypothetical protein
MYRFVRIQLFVLTASIFFYATYAFASSNSNFRPSGEGANTIGGWAVSNIKYSLAEDSSTISAVEFDLDNPAGMVKASINSSSDAFYSCMNTMGTHWVCNTNQESISSADALRVIATDA